jgi:hypothetical protein
MKWVAHALYLPREDVRFLEEWLAHHHRLGCAHFHLYALSADGGGVSPRGVALDFSLTDAEIAALVAEILARFPVTRTPWPAGRGGWAEDRRRARADFAAGRPGSGWCLFVDLDEFLVAEPPLAPSGPVSLSVRTLEDRHAHETALEIAAPGVDEVPAPGSEPEFRELGASAAAAGAPSASLTVHRYRGAPADERAGDRRALLGGDRRALAAGGAGDARLDRSGFVATALTVGLRTPRCRGPVRPRARAPATRAVVCFVEDRWDLVAQALALRESWLQVGCPDTDLVVMGPPDVLARFPDDVVKLRQRAVADDPEWLDYRYANAVAALNGAAAHELDRYAHLLRTDVDTFLAPGWRAFRPVGFACGQGGYNDVPEVAERLAAIAAEYGLTHRGLRNTGSSWYGPTPLIRRVAALSEMLTRDIRGRLFRTGPGAWPGWYEGVSSMYGSELAINHLAGDTTITDRLDHLSTSPAPPGRVAHVHCWHTDAAFSKFAFAAGRYDHLIGPPELGTIPGYCLEMAFRARRPSPAVR